MGLHIRKMFADNHTKEITIDTKCMGKFFLIKDE